MKDHAERIEFEIDHEKLTRYWRAFGFTWIAVLSCVVIAFSSAASSFDAIGDALGEGGDVTPGFVLQMVALRAASGLAWGLAIAGALYFLGVHFQSRYRARALRLSVEGACLRYRCGWLIRQDRRIHFRAISDYGSLDGPILRFFGLKALTFRVVGAPGGAAVIVPAIVDAETVRDTLCEVDAAREGG